MRMRLHKLLWFVFPLMLVVATMTSGALGRGSASAQAMSPQLSLVNGSWDGDYRVLGRHWEPTASISISHESADGTVVESFSATTDSNGFFGFDAFVREFASGDRVSAFGAGSVRTVAIPNLMVDFDAAARRIVVRGEPSAEYRVFSCSNVTSTVPVCDLNTLSLSNNGGILRVDFEEYEIGDIISVSVKGEELSYFQAEIVVPGFLQPLSLPVAGAGPVVFSGGTLDQLVGSLHDQGGGRIWALTTDGWRCHDLDAPDFVNRSFDEYFSRGIPLKTEMTFVR